MFIDIFETVISENNDYIVMKITINFGDGNGNQYIIEQYSIEYNPVKPKFSSSGVYNGGEHLKKTINQNQFEKLQLVFNKALRNKASHTRNRVKGSGVITIQEGNSVKSCIISPNSEIIKEIESTLNDLI